MTVLRIGTRASTLAHAQAQLVGDRLRDGLGVDVELVDIRTSGDRSDAPLTQIGGQGVFTGAVREALVDGTVDIAVHSLKDLPTATDPRVTLAAVPRREDPRDALVSRAGRALRDLPSGARVGTGSPRRAAQLRALPLPLEVVPLRGNVETRLAKVASGECDAVVLACAGLIRVGRSAHITESLDVDTMMPAPGQGALAVEVSADAGRLAGEVADLLDDDHTRASVSAERAVLHRLGAGCSAPVGALASVTGGTPPTLRLQAVVAAVDGASLVRREDSAPPDAATRLGAELAESLLAGGAVELMQERAS